MRRSMAQLRHELDEWQRSTEFTRQCTRPVDAGDQMALRDAASLLERYDGALTSLESVAREFVDYWTRRTLVNGTANGCGMCGGVPHSTTCFVGRMAALLEGEMTYRYKVKAVCTATLLETWTVTSTRPLANDDEVQEALSNLDHDEFDLEFQGQEIDNERDRTVMSVERLPPEASGEPK